MLVMDSEPVELLKHFFVSVKLIVKYFFFFVALGLSHFLCIPYFHWEFCIRNTRNWHLTVSSLLAA